VHVGAFGHKSIYEKGRKYRMSFFLAPSEGDDPCEWIAEDALDSGLRSKTFEAVCVGEVRGTGHDLKVPKCVVVEINSGQ
jgi:hypothetical protein